MKNYIFTPANAAFDPAHEVPQHLAHKPMFALPYEAFDGCYAGQSDVQFITIGLAQYDPDKVSIKTMRYVGDRWTRQAEELPIHRPIDMTIFLAKCLFDSKAGIVTIPKGTLKNQSSDITINPEQRSYGETASYHADIGTQTVDLKEQLCQLLDCLTELKRLKKI